MKISMDPGKYWTWVDKPAPIQKNFRWMNGCCEEQIPPEKMQLLPP